MSPTQGDNEMTNGKAYLGDGVYVERHLGMILLYTMEGAEIYLEPEVYEALKKFAEEK